MLISLKRNYRDLTRRDREEEEMGDREGKIRKSLPRNT
jgi:hypothetical protein